MIVANLLLTICIIHHQVVVLNTNLYNAPDNLTRGKEDPCGQFSWLEQQFQLALAKDAKVNIRMLFVYDKNAALDRQSSV
jgi:hypothetical protein